MEGKFKTLIDSYLTCRYKKVILNNDTNTNSSQKWELIKNGVPQGSCIGPLFFLLYINDLPKIITKNDIMVLFADDASLLITDSNDLDFNININQSSRNMISWFNSNLLLLNFNKTPLVEFRTKNYYQVKPKVKYEHKNTSNSADTKQISSWDQHIDQIATKLCSACYALRNLKHTRIVPQIHWEQFITFIYIPF